MAKNERVIVIKTDGDKMIVVHDGPASIDETPDPNALQTTMTIGGILFDAAQADVIVKHAEACAKAATEMEREACAQLADSRSAFYGHAIAAIIRARK